MSDGPVLIIGGGISGLSTAYYLGKRGIKSILLEKSGRLGGLIRTELVNDCQLEAGPDSYIAAKRAATELAEELPALRGQIIGSNDRERRIDIVRGSRLVPLPKGMSMMVPGDLSAALRSPLFGIRTKMRFLAELTVRPRTRPDDASIAEFVTDHFGNEALRLVAEPLLSGVFGGDSALLSARSVLPRFVGYEEKAGSLIRSVRAEQTNGQKNASLFLSFQGGMGALTDALAEAICPQTEIVHGRAIRMERAGAGWRVHWDGGHIDGSHLVMACPAYVCSGLVESFAAELSDELRAIPYSSALLVSLLFRRAAVANEPDGVGFLVPRQERRTIAAATWIHRKFPSRIAPGLLAIRAFVVDPESSTLLEKTPEYATGLVRADLARLLNLGAEPVASRFYAWPRSMPQYLVGHEARVERIRALLGQYDGLYLVSNALDGVGIPDCVRQGKETANRIAEATRC